MKKIRPDSKVNTFYVIMSGLFTYTQNRVEKELLLEQYIPWKNRINGGDYEGTYHYLKNSYEKC